jgi:site-specific recombinase XerD
MLTVIEPINHEQRYKNAISKDKDDWKEPLIKQFLNDLEQGVNIKGNKGRRSYIRLNTLRSRLKNWERWVYQEHKKKLTKLTYKDIHKVYSKLVNGEIRRKDGKCYEGYTDYGKDIKTFWNWYMRHSKREGKSKTIDNITTDLDTTDKTTRTFNHLDYEQYELLVNKVNKKYRPLMWFLFDSGIRSPKELINIRIKDISEDKQTGKLHLHIREEYSKTIGRKIRLMLCSEILRTYIKDKNLKSNDQLFPISPGSINKMLAKNVYELFDIGEPYKVTEKTKGKSFQRTMIRNGFHLYDIRHCSACYWIQRYKSESQLKYRFGWKRSDRIFYYTHFLGLEDGITEDDIYTETDKRNTDKKIEALEDALLEINKRLMKDHLKKQ